MMEGNSKKLFPLSTGGSVQDRIVNAEALSAEERLVVERCLKMVAGGRPLGVLVGIMRGPCGWDLRPLLLESASSSGALVLLRFSDPALALEREKFDGLQRCQSLALSLKGRGGILAWGEADGQLWIKRKFYQQTLAEIYSGARPPSSIVSPVQVVQRLISLLRVWHSSQIFHGHVSMENVALDGQQPVLLDAGFGAYRSREALPGEGLAPEVSRAQSVSAASDIYGLGLVLRALLGGELSREHLSMIEAMLHAEPASRPTLGEVEKSFFPQAPSSRKQEVAASVSSSAIKSGRVLGAGQSKPVHEGLLKSDRPSGDGQRPAVLSASDSAPAGLKPARPPASPQRRWLFFLLGLVACAGVLYYYGALNFYPSAAIRQARFAEKWRSEQAAGMLDVARAAVEEGDEAARAVIIEDALQGHNRQQVQDSLLRTAFNPKWADELNASDRKVALALALKKLLPVQGNRLPPLPGMHAGVVLAAVGDLSLELSAGQFSDIPIAKLAKLPVPFGWAFGELERQEIPDMGAPPAQALCHILAGNLSEEVFETYLGKDSSEPVVLGRLLIVLPFVELFPEIQEYLYAQLAKRGDVFSRRIEWFEAEKVAEWAKVSKSDKLILATGSLQSLALSFEQYCDLLKFPGAAVRREAEKALAGALPAKKIGGALSFLASDRNQLTRYQVVSLLSALRLEGESAYSFVARWFDTKPDPQSVMGILLERRAVPKLDPFNVEASRYLTTQQWQLALSDLELLAGHEEALARALAYSRLNPAVPEEARILKTAALREPSDKIRAELLRKLEGGGEQ